MNLLIIWRDEGNHDDKVDRWKAANIFISVIRSNDTSIRRTVFDDTGIENILGKKKKAPSELGIGKRMNEWTSE